MRAAKPLALVLAGMLFGWLAGAGLRTTPGHRALAQSKPADA